MPTYPPLEDLPSDPLGIRKYLADLITEQLDTRQVYMDKYTAYTPFLKNIPPTEAIIAEGENATPLDIDLKATFVDRSGTSLADKHIDNEGDAPEIDAVKNDNDPEEAEVVKEVSPATDHAILKGVMYLQNIIQLIDAGDYEEAGRLANLAAVNIGRVRTFATPTMKSDLIGPLSDAQIVLRGPEDETEKAELQADGNLCIADRLIALGAAAGKGTPPERLPG